MIHLLSSAVVRLSANMDALPSPTLSEDFMATLNAASRLSYFALSQTYALVRPLSLSAFSRVS